MNMTIFSISNSIASKPFKDTAINRLDVMNELFYYLTLAFCFPFTHFNPDDVAREKIGYFFNTLVIAMLIINFIMIGFDILRLILRYF